MPTLKLHYDGWIALPAGLREALGLSSGDRIDAELVDGTIRLRPAKTGRPARGADVGAPAPDAPPSAGPDRAARGRRTAEGGATPPKRRGRPPKAATAVQPTVQQHPLAGIGQPRLVKKTDLETRPAPEAAAPAPVARIRPDRPSQAVERRPFGNVEIRPLGPGRGHNRTRRLTPW